MADPYVPPPGGGVYTAFDRFLFGLCFGMGFVIASNVVAFIGSFFHK